MIREDRSDPYWWDNLPKDNIVSLGIQTNDSEFPEYKLTCPEDHNYQFYHYKWKKITFGSGKEHTEERIAIGMVTDSCGSAEEIMIGPDIQATHTTTNVLRDGRNLELHGIRLAEIN